MQIVTFKQTLHELQNKVRKGMIIKPTNLLLFEKQYINILSFQTVASKHCNYATSYVTKTKKAGQTGH